MGKYEEQKQKLNRQYRESAERSRTRGPGVGDEKLARNNRDMQRLKEAEVKTLREMQATAPNSDERAAVDHTLDKTQREASEFKERADHYERKSNRGS